MPVRLVLGTQWGDEGKGKIVDYYSKDAHYVVRFQGGNNAGHTIKVGDDVYKLHIIPSGVIQGKVGVIGNGCVIDPEVLLAEIATLKKKRIIPNLLISDRAHIIMPYHKSLDGADENLLGKEKIGTTKRGIGPCYSDKISRKGIRTSDLLNQQVLKKKLELILPLKQRQYEIYGILKHLDFTKIFQKYVKFGQELKHYIVPTHIRLQHAIESGKTILLEGAQGTMLDVEFGTYPFTTSSNTVAGGASSGAGISPYLISDIIGVVKAYTTRVGEGPLPTEQINPNGKHLAQKGHEFGTTTNRPRRCGWLDLVVVKHSCYVSGVTSIAITKLDVLDGLKQIKICIGYKIDSKKIDFFPSDIEQVKKCIPIYKDFKGWKFIKRDSKTFPDLPKEAQQFLKFIEREIQIPISLVSIGPERSETIEV